MARGGRRPGAGRKKGGKNKKAAAKTARSGKYKSAKTPLDYMLAVMSDTGASDDRRDKMAIAAAPYLHARAEGGKKKKAQDTAGKLARERDAEWGNDLFGAPN